MTNFPTEQLLDTDQQFPLIFSAPIEHFDILKWVAQNRDYLDQKLLQHGSLVFKGFGINTMEKFENLAMLLCNKLYRDYGDLPKRKESEQLYHATPYTASLSIYFHNEASHTSCWPLRQFFLCVQEAEQGGELRVSDGRAILKSLDKELVREFIDKRLMYVRNFIPYVDVSWQDFYKIDNKFQLEGYLKEKGIDFEWKGEVLQTRQRALALANHPKSGELLWFNQIQLHHPHMLEKDVYSGLKALFGQEKDFPRYVCFGDGSAISDAIIDEISSALDKHAVSIAAKGGDVIFNDNMLVSHSRLPYIGKREVCVALGDPIENFQVDVVSEQALYA